MRVYKTKPSWKWSSLFPAHWSLEEEFHHFSAFWAIFCSQVMHVQRTVVGFIPCSEQNRWECYGCGIRPTSTTVIDMSQWNCVHKSRPKFIQAVSHFNNQCKSCLLWSQWPCSLRRKFWPPGCWDHGFESHFGHGCFSFVFICRFVVRRGLVTIWSLIQGVLQCMCARNKCVMEKAWAIQQLV
jgi:hypothetical protein